MSGSGDKQTSSPRMGFGGSSLAIGIGLAVAVLALVAVIFYLLKATNVVETAALVVGDREVSRADYDKYVKAGKELGVSEANAKKIIIEHEKNRNIADKYEIELPDTYVELNRDNMIVEASAQKLGGTVEQLTEADDSLTELRIYNAAINKYLGDSVSDGWAIVMYDAPYFNTVPDSVGDPALQDTTEAKAAAETFLKDLRTRLKDETVSTKDAIAELKDFTAGRAEQTGMRFVQKSSDNEDVFNSQMRAGVFDQEFLPGFLEKQKTGLSEVSDYDGRNALFVDVLFSQKGDAELLGKTSEDKEQMKVVDYVRN